MNLINRLNFKNMNELTEKRENLLNEFINLSEVEKTALWNNFCQSESGEMDEYINEMCEFDEHFEGRTPTEIANEVRFSEFNTNDSFFAYDRSVNLVSFNFIEKYDWFSESELIDYFIDNEIEL